MINQLQKAKLKKHNNRVQKIISYLALKTFIHELKATKGGMAEWSWRRTCNVVIRVLVPP